MDNPLLIILVKMEILWLLILSNRAKMHERCFYSIRCLHQMCHRVYLLFLEMRLFNYFESLLINIKS